MTGKKLYWPFRDPVLWVSSGTAPSLFVGPSDTSRELAQLGCFWLRFQHPSTLKSKQAMFLMQKLLSSLLRRKFEVIQQRNKLALYAVSTVSSLFCNDHCRKFYSSFTVRYGSRLAFIFITFLPMKATAAWTPVFEIRRIPEFWGMQNSDSMLEFCEIMRKQRNLGAVFVWFDCGGSCHFGRS